MEDTPVEGVGVPVPVSGAVESVSTTLTSPEDKVEALHGNPPRSQVRRIGRRARRKGCKPPAPPCGRTRI